MTPAHPGHSVNTGVVQPLPPTVPHVRTFGAVAVPKRISQVHSAVQEGGGAEVMAFGGGGEKGGYIKVVQSLWVHPQYFTVFQVPGESIVGGGW